MKINNNKGFTLIELLIVVAIIAILAAIAIPQFSAYRIRGYNASAQSDLRNIATTQEALYADSQGYGMIAAAASLGLANCAAGASAAITGPTNAATQVAGPATNTFLQNAISSTGFALSNNVTIIGRVTDPTATFVCGSYLMVTKHNQGNSCFGRDSDSQAMYRTQNVALAALTAAGVPAATISIDNFNAAAGAATCAGSNWTIM